MPSEISINVSFSLIVYKDKLPIKSSNWFENNLL